MSGAITSSKRAAGFAPPGRGTATLLQLALLLCLAALGPTAAWPQQQFAGLCARVKIVILQELAIERIGFEATLEVTDNDGEDPLTDFSAELTFTRPASANYPTATDSSSLFFVRAPQLENINDITGSGVIGATRKAVVK